MDYEHFDEYLAGYLAAGIDDVTAAELAYEDCESEKADHDDFIYDCMREGE